MARRNRRNPNTNYGERSKNNRDYIAIVSKNKLVGIWTGKEETSKVIAAPNDRDTRLGALQLFDEVLDRIPENHDLLDKQVAIYCLDCLFNCILRPGDVIRSSEISDEVKEMIPALVEKYTARNYNCFLVSEQGSNATIVSEGFDWLQEMAERFTAQAMGVTYEKKDTNANSSAPEMSAEDKARLAELKTKLAQAEDELLDADDEEIEAKLEKKIAKLQSMIARTLANAGQKADSQAQAQA